MSGMSSDQIAATTARAIAPVAAAVSAPLEDQPLDPLRRTLSAVHTPEPMTSPVPERRAAVRPQAPDVLANLQPSKSGPRVEVVARATSAFAGAAAEAIARAEATHQSPSHPPGSVRAPGRGDSWGHDTSGKIPLRPVQSGVSKGRSKEELMDQARNYVCRSCQTPIPSGHKFCGRCGASVPQDILTLREEFYGTLQVPGRAKLIMIRADGDPSLEGISYALNAQEHIVGREGNLTWPEDRFVSAKHANVFYRGGSLVIRDEGSLNGVYVRMRGSIEVQPGEMFFAGEQLFRFDATPKATDHPEADGTYFWSSPKRPSPFRIVQTLQGGAAGITICARESGITIGREGGELNFPSDVYMSATHCRIEADPAGARFTLTDLNSRNGTYVRIRSERELVHGDYVFIGRKILRVEITS